MIGELSHVFSKRDVFVPTLGATTRWGWIVQAGYLIDQSDVTGIISALALDGFMVIVVSFIYDELVSAMLFVGGEHAYSMWALGPAGSLARMWAIVFGYISVVAPEAVALPNALAYIVPSFGVFELWTIVGRPIYGTQAAAGVIGSVAIMYLDYRGIRPTAQSQAILVLVIMLSGLTLPLSALFDGTSPSPPPLAGAGIDGVFTIAIMAPFMFVGFGVIPQAAGEADVSSKFLGGLIGLSVACTTAFYIAVIWAAGQVATGMAFAESSSPVTTVMEVTFDSVTAGRIMALAGSAGILMSWDGLVLGASHVTYAMADSHTFPERLVTIHNDHDVPSTAVVLVGGPAALAPLSGEQMLVWIVNAGRFGMVTVWLLVVVLSLVLRYHDPDFDRPFKLPAGYAIGALGLLLIVFFVGPYFPGSPPALAWPYEWAMVGGRCLLGVVLLAVADRLPTQTEAETHLGAQQLEDWFASASGSRNAM